MDIQKTGLLPNGSHPESCRYTIPNISGVGLQKSSYDGVDIVIKYEPDDAAAREKWRKEHRPAPK